MGDCRQVVRGVLSSSGLHGCLVDAGHRVLFASHEASQRLGLRPGQQLRLNSVGIDGEFEVSFEHNKQPTPVQVVYAGNDRLVIFESDLSQLHEEKTRAIFEYVTNSLIRKVDRLLTRFSDLATDVLRQKNLEPEITDELVAFSSECAQLLYQNIDVWSVMACYDDLPYQEQERIEILPLLLEALAVRIEEVKGYTLEYHGEMGVLYGSRRWMIAVIRSAVHFLYEKYDSRRIGIRLSQIDTHLVIRIEDLKDRIVPEGATRLAPTRTAQVQTIDLDLAVQVTKTHGGRIRIPADDSEPRILISLPTGAPVVGREDAAGQIDLIRQIALISKLRAGASPNA